jgi:hypothetical protein
MSDCCASPYVAIENESVPKLIVDRCLSIVQRRDLTRASEPLSR